MEEVRKSKIKISGVNDQFSIYSAEAAGGSHLSTSYGRRNKSRNSRKLLYASEDGKTTQSVLPRVEKTLGLSEGKGPQSLAKHESMVVPQREGSVRFRGIGGGRGSSSYQISAADRHLSGIKEDDQELVDSESKTVISSRSDPDPGDTKSNSSGLDARNKWLRVKHSLGLDHLCAKVITSGSGDFLEHAEEERTSQDGDDGCRAGTRATEGPKKKGPVRAKGRKGMEGILVKQHKGIMERVQDFYVACLKLPIVHFLVGIFLAPIALGLLFTPVYLLDTRGLSFDGVTLAEVCINVTRVAAAKKRATALLNVFLYALSLSTTLGGSRVSALSPFCLCIANVNTLMGQFLFVFLSGAVFARMSQPSKPIRCSKKAIIRPDDFIAMASDDEPKEKFK